MQTLVKKTIESDSFDAVVASEIDTGPYAILVKNTPKLIDDVEVTSLYDQFSTQKTLLSKIRFGLTWWKLSRFLTRMLESFSGCTVVSEQERNLIMKIKPEYGKLTVVPNFVEMEEYVGNFDTPKKDTLIYSGALTYSANFDAMDFFLRDIFPQVKAKHPNIKLCITGDYNGVAVNRLPLVDGVELTSYLDDIQSAIAQSWTSVVPLRVGSGTRIKILEAMALGTPVISTSKGAEGLEVTHRKDILLADTPEEFAQTVLKLLEDENLRTELARHGRQLVEEKYSSKVLARRIEKLLNQVVFEWRNSLEVKL
jgi:glycosyltransferase involved in cell wall biosynthesis